MSGYLVGLQTIQSGATKQGDQIVKFQLASHLIRKGNGEEITKVKENRQERIDPKSKSKDAEDFGGYTMSLMVAGVMDTSISLSDFLDSIWIQNALLAGSGSDDPDLPDEAFYGAFEISTPKPDAPAINLLLYFRKSQQDKAEKLASAVEAKILPGLQEMTQDGIAYAGQILPSDKVRRRITAEKEYLYGLNENWGAYSMKIRFTGSSEYKGYINGGACLGIHLDDMSYIPFERIVKLVVACRMVGSMDAERVEIQERVFQHQDRLEAYLESLDGADNRILADVVADVIVVLNVGTLYDRKLARSRDFWKKIRGL